MNYKIAINKMQLDSKLPPGDYRWAQLNDSFVNQELSQMDIANAAYMGQPYTSWHNGRRKDENFICSQFVAVDMDTEDERSSIPYLMAMEFVQVYGGILYTTPNHRPDAPRTRIMFFLDQPINDSAAYEVAIAFVYGLFPGCDVSCVDSSRFYYGSKNATIELPGNTLPVAHLRAFYNRWRKLAQPVEKTRQATTGRAVYKPTPQKPGILTPDTFLNYAIDDASGQGRNSRGYRLARQLNELGLSKFEAEGYMRRYQQMVERSGPHNYTETEALTSLKSAYGRSAMH